MSEENKKLKSVSWWASVLIPTIVLSVGAWFGGIWWNKYEDRPRYLEFSVNKIDAMIPKPETGEAKLTLKLNDRTVSNLSNITVTVKNTEDRDFEEAELLIRISAGKQYLPDKINNRVTQGASKTELIAVTKSISAYIDEQRNE